MRLSVNLMWHWVAFVQKIKRMVRKIGIGKKTENRYDEDENYYEDAYFKER